MKLSRSPARYVPPAVHRAARAPAANDEVAALRALLREHLARGSCSGDDLARQLALHRRTFNRRLKAHGTTFRAVLESVRYELARELLLAGAIPLAHIPARLAYSSSSAFTRAFRRWSGTSPARWRDARRGN